MLHSFLICYQSFLTQTWIKEADEKKKEKHAGYICNEETKTTAARLKDTIKDITSDSQVNSFFPYRWSPANMSLAKPFC